MAFSDEELERYARHIVLREIGGLGQRKLHEAPPVTKANPHAANRIVVTPTSPEFMLKQFDPRPGSALRPKVHYFFNS